MKLFTNILMLICFANFSGAQSEDYEMLWKDVAKHESEGLIKSALSVVESISDLAKKQNNTPQQIKALLHKSKYALTLEEEAQLKIINEFKSEISKSSIPSKNLLENMLAAIYWQYFQNNRYQFYNRTNTDVKIDDDFRTWDLQTLFNEIQLYYNRSLQNGLILQQTSLVDYNTILNTQKDSKLYRPTLYDLLSHNALDFYKTSENSISKPSYAFEIDNPNWLGPSETFITSPLQSKDSSSLQLQALKIYQNLARFHANDNNPQALIDVDIQRLKYVYQHATFSEKDMIFENTLQASSKRFADHPASGLYQYELAVLWMQQGRTYNAISNTDTQWRLKKAVDLCNDVIKKFPNSKASEKCKILISQIKTSTLGITAETVIPVKTYSKFLISYSNLEALNFEVYNISLNQGLKFKDIYKSEDKLKFLNKLTVSKRWSSPLKNEGDFQKHTTEVVLPKLDNGHYIILAKANNEAKTFATQIIQVTDFALVEKSTKDEIWFQIIDRNNGQPIPEVTAKLNYAVDHRKTFRKKTMVSDDEGNIRLLKTGSSYYKLSIGLTKDNQTAYFDDYYSNRYYDDSETKTQYKAFTFSDRSIYRPGQTVYFKSILIESEKGSSSPITNENVFATLHNVNGEQVSELDLVTNDYGSVAGEFILPNSGLNGQYYIEIYVSAGLLKSYYYFSIEEYKRPKFETTFNPISESYKVNDSIIAKGKALAYAGSSITDAKVVYRVVRKVQYPRWYYWYRPWTQNEPQEIAYGEVITNDKGEFEIPFVAIPDLKSDKASLPIFQYEVSADVTDINGETRSASTIVNVGYHTLVANLDVKDKLNKTKKDHQLTIETLNLNNEFVPATGVVKIYKLKAPNRVLRERLWNAPDYQDIPFEEFITKFPHEAYAQEGNPVYWEKGALVLELPFDTKKDKNISLGNIKSWDSGLYTFILESQDQFGQTITEEQRARIYNPKEKTIADHQLFNITTDKDTYQVNDTVTLTLASAAEDLTVTISVEKNSVITDTYVVKLNDNKKRLSIPVTKNDVGGFAIHYSFSAFNSFNGSKLLINVPYPKSELQIETNTFRDKLKPGTDETWSFTVKGPKGEKVSAELLASMYDMSLDQFKPHNWSFNPIDTPSYYSRVALNANRSFGVRGFRIHNRERLTSNYTVQGYDQLNWFGFNLNRNYRRQYLRRKYNTFPSSYTASKKETIDSGYVKGVIVDEEGLPLIGVNVVLSGTKNGVQSDFDGEFLIKAKGKSTLIINYIGYKSLEINIDSNNYYKIILMPDYDTLEEVVVVGYGVKETKTVPAGSYMIVNDSLDQALAGQVSGLNVTPNSGSPGGETPVFLKGVSSLTESDSDEYSQQELNAKTELETIQTRKNLQETAFFFPQLHTDKEGHVSFSFTSPEALTKWKLQVLAHTKTMESTVSTLESVTQKELMVIPNVPRFLRQRDSVVMSSKIVNLTEKELKGIAVMHCFAPSEKGQSINARIQNKTVQQEFSIPAKGNTNINWSMVLPDDLDLIEINFGASAGDFSDGEKHTVPVLTNRMLVTETLPMWIKTNESRTFTLDKLRTTTSTTLKHHKLTLEMTSNPAWYAVQALPYLMEYPYECNEQTFSRYYANALASHIANSNPKIQEVFNQWKNADALLSNLEKNEELKSILIQETPWLRDAQSETEQKKRIGLLFDLNKMKYELDASVNKLKRNQMSNGAWPWFNGGKSNRYITQHIITGFAHLDKLKGSSSPSEKQMINKAMNYLDAEFVKEYKDIKKYNPNADLSKDHLTNTQLQYLYLRSFLSDEKPSKDVIKIMDYYYSQIKSYWLKKSLYSKGLMALIMHRKDDTIVAEKIFKSLKENSITSDELGMYWKENTNSWYWYQAPIETQALLIEAFAEAYPQDSETVDNLKIWLLKNKQTNQWKTTKATTEAVYALLLQGSDWLSVTEMVDVVIGGKVISPSQLKDTELEAGTGYYKTHWNPEHINPSMATVELNKKGEGIAWGSLYWQYFEDLDKITSAETPLKLKKKLFKKTNTDLGEQITEISSDTKLIVGDLVRVRIELRSDRNMEFIHMKDMRASGLEPINVLSQYKWQDGLGYYESTKDASTNFFFDYLPKGVYVFEYDLRVTNAGDMSNGITTIQSMYAPEFSSHSEVNRIMVDRN